MTATLVIQEEWRILMNSNISKLTLGQANATQTRSTNRDQDHEPTFQGHNQMCSASMKT